MDVNNRSAREQRAAKILTQTDRIIDAQVGVIGSMLIEPDLVSEVMRICRSEDFFGVYRTIFDAAVRLFSAMKPVDIITVNNETGKQYTEKLKEILYLTPTAANWKVYAEMLHEDAQLRRLQDVAEEIRQALSLEEARGAAERMASMLADRPDLRIVSFSQGLREFILRQSEKKPPDYVQWGVKALDENLYTEPGDFVVIGGFPSAGKTVLATQFAFTLATRQRIGVFSLETKDKKIYDRLIAYAAKVNFENVKRHDLSEEQMKAIVSLGAVADSIRLEVIDAAGMSVADIQAISLSRHFDLIFIDYLQLLQGDGLTRTEKVTNISLALRTMAGRTGITVVALSQLRRREGGEKNKPPTMSDLRESGQLEQDADVVMLLYLDNEDNPNGDRLLKIAKNKEGGRGYIKLGFYPKYISLYPKGNEMYEYKPPSSRFKPVKDDEGPTPFEQLPL
jgi:replicative DNA helicase